MPGALPAAWRPVANAEDIPSPALLVCEELALRNIDRAIAIAGDPARLRPHIKTHKLRELVQAQVARGVTRFKCATIPEAEVAAGGGAGEVLVAYPMVGPNARRLVELARKFPGARFGLAIDSKEALREIATAHAAASQVIDLYIDVDCGMGRTGIAPGGELLALHHAMLGLPGLQFAGLHAYDGHIHDADPAARQAQCDADFAPVERLRATLAASTGRPVPLIAGGTPTFPMHARRPGVQCAPGTFIFWDFGYAEKLPDLPFEVAALLLTRVISRPSSNRLCLDLGYKAVASENPQPRVRLLGLPDAKVVMHSEEHMVVETPEPSSARVGDALYAIPRHICPTVALYGEVHVIRDGLACETWRVQARERRLDV